MVLPLRWEWIEIPCPNGKIFNFNDLSTLNYEMHKLTGIDYAGIK